MGALSRWVALLHAPDEYLLVPKNPGPGALVQVMSHIENNMKVWAHSHVVTYFMIQAASFARGGPEAEHPGNTSLRGHVVSASQLRAGSFYNHVPLLDPATCACSGAHTCFEKLNALDTG